MRLTGIKVYAPVFDLSGYGAWSRAYLKCLVRRGVPICISSSLFKRNSLATFDEELLVLEETADLLKPYIDKKIDYNLVLAWLTPPLAKKAFALENHSTRKVVITLWETSALHPSWISSLDGTDEVWLPGLWNEAVFQKALSDKPDSPQIRVIGYPLEYINNTSALELEHPETGQLIDSKTTVFYSVSQWTSRKNFPALLTAYWNAFEPEEDVVLLIKTWRDGTTGEQFRIIESDLARLAAITNKPKLPPVGLVRPQLSETNLAAFHNSAECYVTTSRGEGFGLGMIDAGVSANLVVSHRFGEQSSYLTEDNSLIYSHNLVDVPPVKVGLYQPPQRWAEADQDSLKKALRLATDANLRKAKGAMLQSELLAKMNPATVIDHLLDAIEQVLSG